MAILNPTQLAQIRNGCEKVEPNINYIKPQINAAIQALEDYFENTARAGFGAAIEAAAPGIFTNAQKKRIGRFYLFLKFGLEI